MPTQTIHEVITKIVDINPDLNLTNLNNLLIASGWEKNDIDIGLNYFDKNINKVVTLIEVLPIVKEDFLPVESDPNVLSIQKVKTIEIKNETSKHNMYIAINILLLLILLVAMAIYVFKFKL